jgi:outer membrane protein assembly factor BamB
VILAGVMATAGGLLFAGWRDGQFIALNTRGGKPLWHFNTGGHHSIVADVVSREWESTS